MIELKHICKTFDSGGGEVEALKDVSLTIEKGEIYGIIGMSGAGKSTLVRCMNLLERPTSGEIWVNGQELEKMTPKELRRARGEITMIFQHFNLLMQRTCLRNVCFPMELGGMSPRHPYIRVMQRAENDCCRDCDYIVSILPCAKEHFIEHGMKPEKFVCIPNGIVKEDWERPQSEEPPVYRELFDGFKRDGYFLIGYTGAHGVANALDSFLEAGEKLRGERIKLVLVGRGQERERLVQKVKDLNLEEQVVMLPAVRRDAMPGLLAQFDALYVGLQRQPLFRFGVSPNKLMDYMMAAKPVLFAIEAGNDMVADAGCGISIPPEDSGAIAAAAVRLSKMPKGELEAMGRRGREYILAHHEYDVLAQEFLEVFSRPKIGGVHKK